MSETLDLTSSVTSSDEKSIRTRFISVRPFTLTIHLFQPNIIRSFIVIMGAQTAGKRCGQPFREVAADKSQTSMTSQYERTIRTSLKH